MLSLMWLVAPVDADGEISLGGGDVSSVMVAVP